MPVLGVIPARLGSTRLPRKPLQPLGGVSLIVRVARHVRGLAMVDRLVVATDSEEIAAVVEAEGIEAVLTGEHASGTDRVGAVACLPQFCEYDIIVNFQGDEPFLPGEAARGALYRVQVKSDDVGTAARRISMEEAESPDRVKVLLDPGDRALGFTRRWEPALGQTVWQHLGVYAYTRQALIQWVTSPVDPSERRVGLEQLRALAIGLRIGVARIGGTAVPAIDTAHDLKHAEEYWRMHHEAAI